MNKINLQNLHGKIKKLNDRDAEQAKGKITNNKAVFVNTSQEIGKILKTYQKACAKSLMNIGLGDAKDTRSARHNLRVIYEKQKEAGFLRNDKGQNFPIIIVTDRDNSLTSGFPYLNDYVNTSVRYIVDHHGLDYTNNAVLSI